MAEIKRVTLHPLKSDGSIDEDINLYPKTLTTGIVDENGDAVNFPDNSTLVHNTGNENIDGIKTFTSPIKVQSGTCSAKLGFERNDDTDELHLKSYNNDVITDIIFPGQVDDSVELAKKTDCGTKLYEHVLTIQVGSLYYHFRFTSTFSTRITSYELYKSLIVSGLGSITKYAPKSSVFNFYYGSVSLDFNRLVINVGYNYNNDILFSYLDLDGTYKADGSLHVESIADTVTPL